MGILISFAFAFIGAVVLSVAKAVSVYKAIWENQYHLTHFLAFSAGWLFLTIPSLHYACGPIGCSYGLHFAPVLAVLGLILPINQLSGDSLVIFIYVGYLLLSAYFFGHLFGWIIWAMNHLRKMLRSGS